MNALVRLSDTEQKAAHLASLFEDTDAMRKHVPALFATHAHPKMSGRYAFTNTYEILMWMHKQGFRVSSVAGGTSEYNKFMVRMRNTNYDPKNGTAPELCTLDSHDGSRALQNLLGAIKFACMNGCIAGDIMYARRYRHTDPDIMSKIMLDLQDIDEHTKRLTARINDMRNYNTTIGERIALADAAINERYGTESVSDYADMRKNALYVRRAEDSDTDLYTVLNVVQENIIRGGLTYVNSNRRLQRMRSIGAVDRNLHINQRIWLEAERIMTAALERDNVIEHMADTQQHEE
jgi:hypothetical protein